MSVWLVERPDIEANIELILDRYTKSFEFLYRKYGPRELLDRDLVHTFECALVPKMPPARALACLNIDPVL